MLPKISIIIANYNYANFVGPAIESALAQDYPNVEIVVVDDGSTDGSQLEIEKFSSIKFAFKVNGGQTSAVREGLRHVSGEIIIILDSDDLLLPNCCREVADVWNDDVSLVQFKLQKIDNASGAEIGSYPDRPFIVRDQKDYVIKYGEIPSSPTSGNAFNSRHVREAFTYNVDRDRAFTDGYLIYTAPLVGRVVVIDRVLGVYRVHGANASMSAGASLKRLLNHLKTNVSHRQGLADYANRLGLSFKSPYDYLPPYTWRAALFVKKLTGSESVLEKFSLLEILRRGVVSFSVHPNIKFHKRILNVLGLFYIYSMPKYLIERMVK